MRRVGGFEAVGWGWVEGGGGLCLGVGGGLWRGSLEHPCFGGGREPAWRDEPGMHGRTFQTGAPAVCTPISATSARGTVVGDIARGCVAGERRP